CRSRREGPSMRPPLFVRPRCGRCDGMAAGPFGGEMTEGHSFVGGEAAPEVAALEHGFGEGGEDRALSQGGELLSVRADAQGLQLLADCLDVVEAVDEVVEDLVEFLHVSDEGGAEDL